MLEKELDSKICLNLSYLKLWLKLIKEEGYVLVCLRRHRAVASYLYHSLVNHQDKAIGAYGLRSQLVMNSCILQDKDTQAQMGLLKWAILIRFSSPNMVNYFSLSSASNFPTPTSLPAELSWDRRHLLSYTGDCTHIYTYIQTYNYIHTLLKTWA